MITPGSAANVCFTSLKQSERRTENKHRLGRSDKCVTVMKTDYNTAAVWQITACLPALLAGWMAVNLNVYNNKALCAKRSASYPTELIYQSCTSPYTRILFIYSLQYYKLFHLRSGFCKHENSPLSRDLQFKRYNKWY